MGRNVSPTANSNCKDTAKDTAKDAAGRQAPSIVGRFARWRTQPTEAPHSLRLRLALWYGGLLAFALVIFGTVVLLLTIGALDETVRESLRSETRVATLDVRRHLAPTAPYWPAQLTLEAVDTFSNPGVTIEVLDRQGVIHYRSADSTSERLPLPPAAFQSALDGHTTWYDTRVAGERVRVEMVPVRPPEPAATGAAEGVDDDGAPRGNEPVIGVLLVAKSLRDVGQTLGLLQVLLLATGLVTLAAALASGWIIAGGVLQPLREITATAHAIATSTARGTRIGGLARRARRRRGYDELTQLVDTFNDMLAALQRATQTQRRFAADASHELRAPLTTIRGNLAFLRQHLDEIPSEEQRVMLADAHAEALRLARLVDDLLLLARADASADISTDESIVQAAGGLAAGNAADDMGEAEETDSAYSATTGRLAVVELDRAVLQLVRQLRGRLAAEHSTLTLEVGHIEPVRVRGDEEALRRVALILLDNSIKYTAPAAGREQPARITISLERDGGQAVLRVRDTGIGIDPNDLPHIFERFYRADHARGRQGTGLGLAIARALVERMGGQIAAASVPGQGSTFSVRLPLADS